MKIAFVDLGRHYGGIEVYLISLIDEWINRGNECLILVRKDSMFHQKLVQLGLEEKIIPVDFNTKSIREARKRIMEEKIKLLHINGINSGVFANLLNLPIKRVTTVHSSAIYDRADKGILIGKLFEWMENRCLKKSQCIITVSSAIKEMLVKRGIGEKKIEVIYNGIKDYVYNSVEKENSDVFKICYIGRLEKVKGCEYLIRALAKIKDRDFRCDIYGDGSLRGELEKLSEGLDLKDKVTFKGFADNVRNNLNQYDVLIQPSIYEACPLTPIEAMNACTLVICSDVGGMKELIVDKENGLKFEVGNIDKLADNIAWAMEHTEEVRNIQEKAYAEYDSKYRESIMQEKTFQLFER